MFCEDVVNELPGPGNYNQTSGFGHGRSYSMQGKIERKYNENPGPGSYDNKNDLVKDGSKS